MFIISNKLLRLFLFDLHVAGWPSSTSVTCNCFLLRHLEVQSITNPPIFHWIPSLPGGPTNPLRLRRNRSAITISRPFIYQPAIIRRLARPFRNFRKRFYTARRAISPASTKIHPGSLGSKTIRPQSRSQLKL